MISVVIPVFNAEKYLHQCVESILAQSNKEFEVILVNDGSTDGSARICDEYAQKDKRIVVLHQENRGVSAARNAGINLATGEYIIFVDSDDLVESHFFEEGIVALKDNQADLLVSGIAMDKFSGEDIIETQLYTGDTRVYSVKTLLQELNISYPIINVTVPYCKIYKKSIIDAYKIRFNEKMKLNEDALFNVEYLEVLNADNTIVFLETAFYHWQWKNSESLYKSYNGNYYESVVTAYGKMEKLYIKNRCSKDSFMNFRKYYVTFLFSCIHHEYVHRKHSTKAQIYAVMDKVMHDKHIQETSFGEVKGIKKKGMLFLIKRGWKMPLYIMFEIMYRTRREQAS